jgi:hypothetical protein
VPAETLLLWTTLSRLRRRHRLVTLVETGLAAGIVVGAAAVPLFFALAADLAIRLIILSACVAAVAVAIVAVVRTPPPRRLAALADARLHLEDRLVTALQYADDPDAVSRLVVRDATSRLAGASPARVFPFRAPAWIGWIAAVALTASAALTLAGRDTSSGAFRRSNASSGAGVTSAAAGTNGSVRTSEGASSGRASRDQASRDPGPAPARVSGNTQGAAGAGDRGKAPGAHPETSADPAAPPREDGRASAAVALAAALTPAAVAVAPRATGATSSSRGLGSAGGAAARGQSAASGAGGISSRGVAAGSGGAPRTSGAVQPDARQNTNDARYAAARARAEAALAGEQIPPGLRAYLTAYFTAISPR